MCLPVRVSAGIIGAVAKDFFRIQIKMEMVTQTEEAEWTGKKEHVVFLVTQEAVSSNKACSGSKVSLTKPLVSSAPHSAKPTNKQVTPPITNHSGTTAC